MLTKPACRHVLYQEYIIDCILLHVCMYVRKDSQFGTVEHEQNNPLLVSMMDVSCKYSKVYSHTYLPLSGF